MPQIAIIGQFDLHPEDADAAAELMRVMMTETQKENGCHHYAYSRDLATGARFQLSERWEDEAALAAHFQAAHMATYRAGMRQLRVFKRTVQRFDISNVVDL
jgi:quinol monooxygenase YgiN